MKKFCIKDKLYENRYEMIILLLLAGSLAYCLRGTFNFDDVVYYYFRGRYYSEGMSLLEIIIEGQKSWLFKGRFFPLNLIFEYLFYYVLHSYFVYELAIIIIVCINVFLYGKLMFLISNSKKIKLLSMLTIIIFFQVYCTYHNSILGYGALLQMSVLFLLNELIYLIKYLKEGNKRYLYLCCLYQLIGVMWYETNYINIILLFIVYFYYKKDSFYKKCKDYLLLCTPTIICVIITLIIKVSVETGYAGTKIIFNIKNILKTLFIQCFGAIPLSHYITQKNNGIINLTKISIYDIILVTLFFAIFILINQKNSKVVKKPKMIFALLALSGYVFPGSIITLTEKYQNELYLGITHISVYIQYFGLCAFIIWFYLYLEYIFHKSKKEKILKVYHCIVGLLFSAILLINLQVTKSNIWAVNQEVKYPRAAVIEAIENGILDDINEEDILISTKNMQWDNESFFSQYAKKKVTAVSYGEFINNYDLYKNKDTFFINYLGTTEKQVVVICKANEVIIAADKSRIQNIRTDNLTYYIDGNASIIYNNEIINKYEKEQIIDMEDYEFLELELNGEK